MLATIRIGNLNILIPSNWGLHHFKGIFLRFVYMEGKDVGVGYGRLLSLRNPNGIWQEESGYGDNS